ncbi:MAG: methionyl-tRNA formyltransferase [Gammaproteobacteria bacterium]
MEALADSPHRLIAVYTQPDRPAGRGRSLRASPVKDRALALGIRIEQPQSLKSADVQNTLRSLGPDLMVVVAYGLILPQAVLDIPRLGCINLHASLLPRWRGATPIQHALLAGDAETGVSIMQMNSGLDTGDVLLQRCMPIDARATAGDLHARLAGIGASALLEVADWLAKGAVTARPQNEASATYAAKIDKADAVIDWREPAGHIARKVRAFNPWPVAETQLDGERLRIWEAEPLKTPATREPGTVIPDAGGIEVATGDGRLRLLRVQLPGRRTVSAHELRNARSLAGAKLG